MYLSDVDLKALLPGLSIEARDADHPFQADLQIQPCSIDMRVDNIFWKQKRRRGSMDLRRSVVEQVDTRRYWKRVHIGKNQSISLRPGEFVLGRIYEKFTVPNGYAAKITGRSSFARLGLLVHCTADFINPGWHGHMPLQLVNISNTEIRLSPYLPICQVILVRLSTDAARPYGHDELGSKYNDDDGGPSYWWKDFHVKKLKEQLTMQSVPDAIRASVFPLISKRDTELIERFHIFIEEQPSSAITNSTEVLDNFAKREVKSHRWAVCRHRTALWLGPAFLTLTLGSFFRQPYTKLHIALWIVAPIMMLITAWRFFYCDAPGDYLTPAELGKLDRDD